MKRRSFIVIMLLFMINIVRGQEFAQIGASWYYSSADQGAAPAEGAYIHFVSVKDSLLKNKIVRKIERTCYHYRGSVSNLEPLFVYSLADTVFLYNPYKEYFDRLYVFNRNIGDTLTLDVPYTDDDYSSLEKKTYRLVIDSIALETYNGKQIKKYRTIGLDGFQYWNGGWFMDYIGGLDWLFPRKNLFSEADGPLRCYNDSNFTFSFSTIPCDYKLSSSLSKIAEEDVVVLLNPDGNYLKVNATLGVKQIKLFDQQGILRLKSPLAENNISILQPGVYLLKIELNDKRITYKKIIKR